MAPIRFTTPRLTVRAAAASDAAALASLMTAGISRWVAAWPHPLTPARAAEIIAAAGGEDAVAAAPTLSPGGDPIGWLRIERTATEGAELGGVEIGYWIGEAHQRRGYARELAEGAIRFAFETMGARAVTAGAQLENEASHALLAQLGMSPDGERDVWAAGRDRWERCRFWRLQRPDPSTTP